MKMLMPFLLIGSVAVANIDNSKRYFKGGIDIVGGDIVQSNSGATMTIQSDTADATASTTVGAVTIKSSVNVTDGDLVLNVENSAGDNLLTVDEQGLAVVLTDLKVAGNDILGTGAGATMAITSSTNDVTATTTVAVVTINAGVNITDGDLILNVENSVGDNLLTVNEQGLLTVLTDVKVTGNDITGTGTTTTLNIISDAVDATTSATVGAITLKASVNIANTDLVLDVQDSAAAHAFTVDEAGLATALTGLKIGTGTALTAAIGVTTGALDIGAAGANAAVVGTEVVTGAALGDLCQMRPLLDDAAWDEGNLTCFVESAGVVKWQYMADDTGGNPASMTYKILVMRF